MRISPLTYLTAILVVSCSNVRFVPLRLVTSGVNAVTPIGLCAVPFSSGG